MSFLSRLRARRYLDAASAEALLAGRGVPAGAPADQRDLARLLEIAAKPGSEQELGGQVAAAAMFVQVTSQGKPRKIARRVLAAAACATAVAGSVVYASAVPSPHHKMAPVPFGVPAEHHTVPGPAVTRVPSRQPGRRQVHPQTRSGHRKIQQAMNPGVPLRAGSR
jgi:hypothetical protein